MTVVSRALLYFTLIAAALSGAACSQPPPQKQIDVYGQKISYLEAGAGPPVILLHGLGGNSTNWALTVPALAPSFHVYSLDQIGFGQSDKPALNYRVATLVDFLAEFYKKVGIERATLVGNSLGGWVALAFALAHPDKVDRLALVDSGGYSPERTGARMPMREQFMQLNPSTLAGQKMFMSLMVYNKELVTDAFVEQGFTVKLRSNDGGTVNQFIESILRREDYLDGRLGAIKAPTIIIWGREDEVTPLALARAF